MIELQDPIPRTPREAFEYEQKTIEMQMKVGTYKKPEIGYNFSLKPLPVQEDIQMLFLHQFMHDLRSVAHIYESNGRVLQTGYSTRTHDSFEDIRLMVSYTDPATGVSQHAYAGWDSMDNYLRFYAAPEQKDHLSWEVYLPSEDKDNQRLKEVAYWFAQAAGRFLMMDDYPEPHKLCGYDVTFTGPSVNRWPFDPNRELPEWVQNHILRLEN